MAVDRQQGALLAAAAAGASLLGWRLYRRSSKLAVSYGELNGELGLTMASAAQPLRMCAECSGVGCGMMTQRMLTAWLLQCENSIQTLCAVAMQALCRSRRASWQVRVHFCLRIFASARWSVPSTDDQNCLGA